MIVLLAIQRMSLILMTVSMVQIILHNNFTVMMNSDNNSCYAEHELAAAAHTDPTEDFLIESRPVELDTNHSGGNSEKSELDSVGQEIATSMMTVLLPQALPLLKKVSKKNKERNRRTLTKDDPLNDRKLLENDNIDHSVNISFPVAGKI